MQFHFRRETWFCIFLAETSPAQPHHAVLRWTARRSRLLGSQTRGQVYKTNIFLGGTEYHAAEFWSKFKLIKFSESIWPPAQTFDLSSLVLRHHVQRPNASSCQPLFGGTKKPHRGPQSLWTLRASSSGSISANTRDFRQAKSLIDFTGL